MYLNFLYKILFHPKLCTEICAEVLLRLNVNFWCQGLGVHRPTNVYSLCTERIIVQVKNKAKQSLHTQGGYIEWGWGYIEQKRNTLYITLCWSVIKKNSMLILRLEQQRITSRIKYLIPEADSNYRNENNKDLPCNLRHHNNSSNKLYDSKRNRTHPVSNAGVH